MRVRRSVGDRVRGSFDGMRRFRCRSADCGFNGLLTQRRGAGRQTTLRAASARRALLAWGLALAAGVVVAAAAAVVVLKAGWEPLDRVAHPGGPHRLPPGMQFDGTPVVALRTVATAATAAIPPGGPALAASADAMPSAHPAGLALREGCVWGQPGRSPYQGTVEQALRAGRLPDEVVAPLVARIQARQITDRVDIRREGIRAQRDGREFSPRGLALSFGRSMCLESRVNFKPGHVEPADFYEVRDSAGRTHRVIVPDVCGNVSVLSTRGERSTAGKLMAGAGHWLLDHLSARAADDGWQVREAVALADTDKRHTVPEPGTLLCVLAALLGLWWVGRRGG